MDQLMSLRMSNMSDIQSLFRVIEIWLETSDSPTWEVLIATVEGPPIRCKQVAMEIREYLCKPETHEKYVSY